MFATFFKVGTTKSLISVPQPPSRLIFFLKLQSCLWSISYFLAKISTLTQGIFVGTISDNFDGRIEQKIFHAEIVVHNEKVAAETKAYKEIPQILSFTEGHGNGDMKQVIEDNYRQVKTDVLQIVECGVERIKNDPDLQHLIQQD